jgi:hypothetical protein
MLQMAPESPEASFETRSCGSLLRMRTERCLTLVVPGLASVARDD